MPIHSVLMKLPVKEKREFIRKIYSIKLGISYNIVKCTFINLIPKERTYFSLN